MTQVVLSIARGTGEQVVGQMMWRPTARHTDSAGALVLPTASVVSLSSSPEQVVEVPPSPDGDSPAWVWEVTIVSEPTLAARHFQMVERVQVPDESSPVLYADLKRLDPLPQGVSFADLTTLADSAQESAAAAEASAAQALAAEVPVQVVGLSWSGVVSLPQEAQERTAFLVVTLVGDVTVQLPDPAGLVVHTVTIDLSQDAAGGHALVVEGALAAYGVGVQLSSASNARDLLHLLCTPDGWVVLPAAMGVAVPTSWTV